MYHSVEFGNGRCVVIGAENEEVISKFIQQLCDDGLPVSNITPLPIETDETHANILLDDDGEVIYEDTFMICKNAHKTWAKQVEIENEHATGQRHNVYIGRYIPIRNPITLVTTEDFQVFVSANGQTQQSLPLEPSLALSNHSPDGFEIGYHGSGPAQLALAMLLYEFGNPVLALNYYQQFKEEVIAQLPQGQDFALSGEFVRSWVKKTQDHDRIAGKDLPA